MKPLIGAMLLFLISCNVPAVKTPITDSIIKSHDSLKVSKVDSVMDAIRVWQYKDQTDKLTGTTTHSALVVAKEFLDLKFPYNVKNNMVLLSLREKRGKTSVQLNVGSGQFNGGDDPIKVRFDSSKVESYEIGKPDDGSSDALFIENNKKFIKELKNAHTLIIEAEFFENGNQIMEFNVSHLKWDY